MHRSLILLAFLGTHTFAADPAAIAKQELPSLLRVSCLTNDKVPLCMFWLGTQPPATIVEAKAKGTTLPSLHSPYFKPIPEPTIETGVKAMTSAVLGMMKKR